MNSVNYELNCGLGIIVDSEDLPRLSNKMWKVSVRKSGNIYVYDAETKESLARFILNYKGKLKVIRRNMNTFDYRKSNLLLGDNSTLNRFQKPREGLTSKYKGVSFRDKDNCFVSRIYVDGKETVLGYFKSEIEAAKCYDTKALELFGTECYLNFCRDNHLD